MIKLSSVKEKKKKEEEEAQEGKKRESPAELRLNKDVAELSLPPTAQVRFTKGRENMREFELDMCPDEGYYKGGMFTFSFTIPEAYPHEPPKVKCLTAIYHPNIDLEGNVCLNVLREDWRPVLNLNAVCYGLQLLFSEPNPDDPLNKEAADLLRENPNQFANLVRRNLMGGSIGGRYFPPAARR